MIESIRYSQEQLMAAKESELQRQLNDLVSRRILLIEEEQPVFVRDGDTVKILSKIRLTVRDMEIIKKLEAENAKLKRQIEEMERAMREYWSQYGSTGTWESLEDE